MNIEEVRATIINSDNLSELYLAKIETSVALSDEHNARYVMTKDTQQYIESCGRINVLTSLLEIVTSRITHWDNNDARYNYNFRMAAKIVLKEETYNKLIELSKLPRKEVKNKKEDYDNNRLE